jgi:hypothetical protein
VIAYEKARYTVGSYWLCGTHILGCDELRFFQRERVRVDHGVLVSRLRHLPNLAFGHTVYFDARPQCGFIRHFCFLDFERVEENKAGLIEGIFSSL